MTASSLDQAIYKKYIVPTQRPRRPYAGLEFELPIVNLEKKAVDFAVVHALTDAFVEQFGFDELHRDDAGDIYSAIRSENGDGLSYDCSYNTLEFSFGVESDLHVIHGRFVAYYTFIQDFLRRHRHTLTGMGINPGREFNRNEPIPNGRYRMLFRHLSSYRKYGNAVPFHDTPNFGLFCCASQVQLDAEEGTLVETLNTFSRLEPLKALLFANSPYGKNCELLCSRDHFWKHSLHGLNPHNVDGYETPLHSVEEVVAYIKSMSLYCLERDGKYINFPPTPLEQYFARDTVEGEYFDGTQYRTISFAPRLEDLAYLRSFKFEDLTYRGTVEFRSVCTQPVGEIMGSAAFHAGLMENLSALTQLLDRDTVIYQQGYSASELRALFVRRELPSFVDKRRTAELLTQVLDVAKDGLRKRGQGEEVYLEPLYGRAGRLYSPGRRIADGLDNGIPMKYFIEEYASL